MENRELKISFAKSGTGTGAKLTLPIPWLKKLGLSKEDRDINLTLDEEKKIIIISKREDK